MRCRMGLVARVDLVMQFLIMNVALLKIFLFIINKDYTKKRLQMIGQVENRCSPTVMRFFLLLSALFSRRFFGQFFGVVLALSKYDQNRSHDTN